jgi:cytochrome c nitrite reductase small subunit
MMGLKQLAGVALAVSGGIFVGVGGYTFHYAEGSSYLSDDPKACVNCHIMREAYDTWQHSSHSAVAVCNDCHVPQSFLGKWIAKSENGYHHSAAFTLQNFHEPIQIKEKNSQIAEHNCLRCHGDLVNHMRHGVLEGERVDCARCHAEVGHSGRTP